MKLCIHIIILIIVLIQPISCLFNSKALSNKPSVLDKLSKRFEKAYKNGRKQRKSAIARGGETATTTTTTTIAPTTTASTTAASTSTAPTTPTNSVASNCVSIGDCEAGYQCVIESTLCTNSNMTCSCTPGCILVNQFIPMDAYVSTVSCTECTCYENTENVISLSSKKEKTTVNVPLILCRRTNCNIENDQLGGVT